jgi:hypothetical protein
VRKVFWETLRKSAVPTALPTRVAPSLHSTVSLQGHLDGNQQACRVHKCYPEHEARQIRSRERSGEGRGCFLLFPSGILQEELAYFVDHLKDGARTYGKKHRRQEVREGEAANQGSYDGRTPAEQRQQDEVN